MDFGSCRNFNRWVAARFRFSWRVMRFYIEQQRFSNKALAINISHWQTFSKKFFLANTFQVLLLVAVLTGEAEIANFWEVSYRWSASAAAHNPPVQPHFGKIVFGIILGFIIVFINMPIYMCIIISTKLQRIPVFRLVWPSQRKGFRWTWWWRWRCGEVLRTTQRVSGIVFSLVCFYHVSPNCWCGSGSLGLWGLWRLGPRLAPSPATFGWAWPLSSSSFCPLLAPSTHTE